MRVSPPAPRGRGNTLPAPHCSLCGVTALSGCLDGPPRPSCRSERRRAQRAIRRGRRGARPPSARAEDTPTPHPHVGRSRVAAARTVRTRASISFARPSQHHERRTARPRWILEASGEAMARRRRARVCRLSVVSRPRCAGARGWLSTAPFSPAQEENVRAPPGLGSDGLSWRPRELCGREHRYRSPARANTTSGGPLARDARADSPALAPSPVDEPGRCP
jgi:hypothetical protein